MSDTTFLIGKPLQQDLTQLTENQLQDLLDFTAQIFRLTSRELEIFTEIRKEWAQFEKQILEELERRYFVS